MSNIKDVARAAGVSVSTVSNILNNKTSVSEELHQKVIKAMEELDYHPNFLAMNLRKKKISFIGVVVNALNSHYHQIYEGVNRVCKESKCQPILKIAGSANEEYKEIEELMQLSVSGIIVISSNLNDELISHYNATGVPIVFVDHYPIDSEHNIVRFDNSRIVGNLTKMLIRKRRKVGLICGNCYLGSEADCKQGYLDALGVSEQAEPVIFETEFSKERAFSGLINHLCNLPEGINSLIVSAAHLAKTVSEICALLDIKDVEIYALSGDSWYKHRDDSISYLSRDSIQCGIQATELLFENMTKPATFDTRMVTIAPHSDALKLFEEEETSAANPGRGKTLKLLLLESNISNAIKKLCGNFTAQTGIAVSVITATQQELMRIIPENTRRKSDEYDIIMADMHSLAQLKQENAFCKLNSLLDLDEILPRYIRDVRSYILSEAAGEDVYALPVLVGYQMLAYRRDLFDDPLLKKKFYLKYGIQLRPPQSWNEFNLVAKFFTRRFNEESPVDYGTCLVGGKPDGIMSEFLPRQWSYRGKFFGEDGPDMASVPNLKAIKNLAESYCYSYPDCVDFLEDEQVREFAKGNIAMISTYNVHLQDGLDLTDQNIRFARLPGSSALIGGWLLGINAHSKQIEESAQFLNWELSNRISVHSSLLGQISPFKSVFYDNELLTIYPWMSIVNERAIELRGKEPGVTTAPDDGLCRRLETALSENLWKALLGELAPEEVMRETQKQIP
ncbi:MAG: extracellular solute-binding protein [Oscillospiraceae bacterium]|nr:extracellular solute-binding protein [Oscillospiraceae bacterium]